MGACMQIFYPLDGDEQLSNGSGRVDEVVLELEG